MDTTLLGIEMEAKLVHPRNVCGCIVVTPLGMLIDVKLVQP